MRLVGLSLNDELVRAFEGGPSFTASWDGCVRPDWLIELALHAELDRRLLVTLVAPVMERTLEAHGLRTDVPTLVRRWGRSQARAAEAWAAGFRVSELAKDQHGPRATALRAAGALAFACDADSSPSFYAIRGHLVDAVALAMSTLPEGAGASIATELRRGLPAERVEAGLRVRIAQAQPPSRQTGETPKHPHSWPPLAAAED